MKISTLKTQKPKSSASNKTQAAKTPENKAADKTSTSAAKVGAPTVANSPARTYIDTFNTSPDCESNKKKIEEKCKPEPEQTEADKKKGAPKRKGMMAAVANASHKLDALGRLGYKRNDANAWVDTHCDLMWTKPMALSKVENFSKTMTESLEKLKSEKFTLAKNALSELGEVAIDKAGSAATKKLIGLGARSLAKNVVGGAAVVGTLGTVGDFVEAGMLAWTATDIVSTATELAAMAGPEGAAMLANLKDSLNIKEKVASILADLEKHPEKALADSMEFAGKLNPCLRAKRCQLVPMKETSAKKAKEKGQGCCPGQTGHHLLPREMFKRKIDEVIPGQFLKNGKPKTKSVDDPANCPEYTNAMHDNAPVVCVEGTNASTASHGTIHDNMDGLMKKHREKNPGKDSITNDEAMDAAVKSHEETFKTGCDPKCLKAQLKSYYDKLCDGKMKPRGGKGTDVADNEAGNDLGKDTD